MPICQYTGIEFEGGKRQKNHPRVSAMLAAAAKDGSYSRVKKLLDECKAAGYTTIEQVVAHVYAGQDASKQQRQAEDLRRRQQEADLEQARREAKAKRQAQNAFLREHGYTWSRDYGYDSDHYEEPDETFVWRLWAPDGVEVSVAQALDEIARGIEVVRAEIRAKQEAAAEAERQAKAAAEAKEIERKELTMQVVTSTGLECCQDWSWDDFRYEIGSVVAESEHWQAREYWFGQPGQGERLGFVIKEKK